MRRFLPIRLSSLRTFIITAAVFVIGANLFLQAAHSQSAPAGAQLFLPMVQGRSVTSSASSVQLINQALARNEIDAETAILYKVFAEFGDGRLPAPYHGNDSKLIDMHTMDEAAARFGSLSQQAQDQLQPFFTPPM